MIDHDPEKPYQSSKIPDRQPAPAGSKVHQPQPIQLTLAEILHNVSEISTVSTASSISSISVSASASTSSAVAAVSVTSAVSSNPEVSFDPLTFCEVEYESLPADESGRFANTGRMNVTGRFVAEPLKIVPPEKDKIRDLFYRMRDITRQARSTYVDYSRFFDRQVLQDSARIFFQQAGFMQDFTDDYPDQVPFSSYFPNYQMMGYEQLRTYFTWRTQVRKGNVKPTSLSYVFLYIYELLNNVGVAGPQDGLDKLVSLWISFRDHDHSLDKYMIRWFKDYHIYYPVQQSFQSFIEQHQLTARYPILANPEDPFSLFCSLSKYDIRKSAFFADQTNNLITACFSFVLERIRQDFTVAGIPFDEALFHPIKKLKPWQPFRDALFHPWLKQADRRVILTENELYVCSKNEWFYSTVLTTEKGRQFIGYLFKQMESVLRKVTKYKYQITANLSMINQETLNRLNKSGLFIDKIVQSAVIDFYREFTKKVVTVDHDALDRIRQEALATQKALIVAEPTEQAEHEEQAAKSGQAMQADQADQPDSDAAPAVNQPPMPDQNLFADPADVEPEPVSDLWERFKDILDERELQALAVILHGADIRRFADDHEVMLEVLADGINEKAMDMIGDNLLDDELTIYEDYQKQVKGMVE